MANPEHLEILKRSVEEWNQWRKDNPDVEPDLKWADLSGANLTEANLSEADLLQADLIQADLSGANLIGANLVATKLLRAKLLGAKLNGAELAGAHLNGANLVWADLAWASLGKANLSGAILQNASLRVSALIDANFDGANLTGAWLWETQRARWSIKGVICEYVYWDEERKEMSFYSPGEFERLFADKTKVRLFYKDGISPIEIATIPALIKHLEDSHTGSGLRLVNIHEDSGGVVVELTIEDDSNQSPELLKKLKTEIEATAQRAIEYERKFLAEEKQRLQLEGALKHSDAMIDKLILRPSINFQGDYKNMGDEYNISGQAGAVGQNAHAHDMTFNQIANQLGQSIDLATLAKQLAELRQEIAMRQDSSPQSAIAQGETARAEIAAKEGNTSKVVEHLKAAGEWTLDFAKEVGKEVVVAAIKTSMGMQ